MTSIIEESSFDSDRTSSELSGTVVDTPTQEDFDLSSVTDDSPTKHTPYRQCNSFAPDEETFKQMMAEAIVYDPHPRPSRGKQSCDTLETFYRANPVTDNPPTPAKTKPWTPLRVRKRASAPELSQKRGSLIVRNVQRHTSLQLHDALAWQEAYKNLCPTASEEDEETNEETTPLDFSVLRLSPFDGRMKPYLTRYNLKVAVIIKYNEVVLFFNDLGNFNTAVRFRLWKCTRCNKSDSELIRELEAAFHYARLNIMRFIFRLEIPLKVDFGTEVPHKKMTIAKLLRFDTVREAEDLRATSQELGASMRKLHGEICELLDGEGLQTQ